jgi:hypothetical protein
MPPASAVPDNPVRRLRLPELPTDSPECTEIVCSATLVSIATQPDIEAKLDPDTKETEPPQDKLLPAVTDTAEVAEPIDTCNPEIMTEPASPVLPDPAPTDTEPPAPLPDTPVDSARAPERSPPVEEDPVVSATVPLCC